MTPRKRTANYVGGLVIALLPLLYNAAMKTDFPVWAIVVAWLLAAVVAFTDELKRVLRGLVFKVSKSGIELDGDDSK